MSTSIPISFHVRELSPDCVWLLSKFGPGIEGLLICDVAPSVPDSPPPRDVPPGATVVDSSTEGSFSEDSPASGLGGTSVKEPSGSSESAGLGVGESLVGSPVLGFVGRGFTGAGELVPGVLGAAEVGADDEPLGEGFGDIGAGVVGAVVGGGVVGSGVVGPGVVGAGVVGGGVVGGGVVGAGVVGCGVDELPATV